MKRTIPPKADKNGIEILENVKDYFLSLTVMNRTLVRLWRNNGIETHQ